MASLVVWDYLVIALYFVAVIGVGLWASYRAKRGTTQGYFLAGRDMAWWPVGMSLYVSNIGSSSFIGIGGSAAVDGYAVVFYEFSGMACLLILGYIFVPVYISAGVFTLPEYLEKRFGGNRLRWYNSLTAMILVIVQAISSELYAGSIIINQALGWNLYASVCFLLALTAIFTVAGGLAAVMYTDAVQTIIMLIGAAILTVLCFTEVFHSYENFQNLYMNAIPNTTLAGNTSCGVPSWEVWHIFRPVGNPMPSMPWPGVLFGISILGVWYFCTNQVIVQRCLAAKNVTHAKGGTILAGYFKILPMFLMVWPGMASRILFPDEVACQDPDECEKYCGNPSGCSDIAYPKLVVELMPVVLRGLLMAAMLSALMSSFTSLFNSVSTLFTIDVWTKVRPNSSEREQMFVGRIFVLFMVVLSVLWIPVIQLFGQGQLFIYIQSITSYFAPPVLACFLLAILWERTNEPGAFWGLMLGLVIGVTRACIDLFNVPPNCGQADTRPDFLKFWHYLHFAIFLFLVSIIIIVVISLLTEPIPRKKLIGLTWKTLKSKEEREPMNGYQSSGEKVNVILQVRIEENGEIIDTFDKDNLIKEDIEMRNITENGENNNINESEIESQESLGKNESSSDCGVLCALRWVYNWLCGLDEAAQGPQETEEEKELRLKKLCSVEEDPYWGRFININSAILLAVGVFFWGYFG